MYLCAFVGTVILYIRIMQGLWIYKSLLLFIFQFLPLYTALKMRVAENFNSVNIFGYIAVRD
jgi:hypothetical protein